MFVCYTYHQGLLKEVLYRLPRISHTGPCTMHMRCIHTVSAVWALRERSPFSRSRGRESGRLPHQGEEPNESWLRKISPHHKRINANAYRMASKKN